MDAAIDVKLLIDAEDARKLITAYFSREWTDEATMIAENIADRLEVPE